ncbi:MAG: hypothetical protein NZM35_09755 [Chitinophagales bacterium]|nr:hypothetical protein [Chitinophagales bacterium]MDW8419965.1 hypothetical protein [Chitinophagales bacterium]
MKVNYHLFAVTFLLWMASCTKEKPIQPVVNNKSVAPAQMNATMHYSVKTIQLLFYMMNSANSKKNHDEGAPLFDNSCAQVSFTNLPDGNRMATINFGSGCYDAKGVYYSGQVSVTFNNPDLGTPNTEFKIQFNDFVMGDVKQNGKATWKNLGKDDEGIPTGTIRSQVYVNLLSTGYYKYHITDFTIRNHGFEDRVNGSLEIKPTAHDNPECSMNITEELIKPYLDCEFTVSGKVHIQYQNAPDEYLDLGNGTCDNLATLTSNGVSQTVTIDF